MDNLNYEYPSSESKEIFEEMICSSRKEYSRTVKFSLISLALGLAFFTAYSIFISYKYAYVLLILFVILLLISVYSFKITQQAKSFHNLKIKAFDDCMELTYYTHNRKTKLKVCYDDIVSARFSDKNYTSFQMIFSENKNSYIEIFDVKGKKLDNINDNLFLFKLNPLSWEQGFFLYFADEYFDIQGFKFTKRLEKKFGNAEMYFQNLQN